MNISAVIFTSPEASANSTAYTFGVMEGLGMVSFLIFFLFNTPTQICIVWLIVKGPGGVGSEFITFNLCICEIGNGINGLLGFLSKFYQCLILPTHFLQGLGITGRPLFECLMCVERFLAVVYPVTFLKYKPLRYRLVCCSMAWITIVGSSIVCLTIIITSKKEAYVWFFTTQFIFFISVQLFCLVAVLKALKQTGPGERRKEENYKKRRAFYLILITTINIIVQYLPFTATGFFVIVTKVNFFHVWYPAFLFYVFTSFVPPSLYLQRTGKLPCLLALH